MRRAEQYQVLADRHQAALESMDDEQWLACERMMAASMLSVQIAKTHKTMTVKEALQHVIEREVDSGKHMAVVPD